MKLKFLLLMVLLNVGCKNLIPIRFSDYKRYQLKEAHTSVILLKTFIVNKKCNDAKREIYANAFLCKTTVTNDTILVFTICKPLYPFLRKDYTDERDLIIDSSKTYYNHTDKVFVNIEDSVIKKGYRFVVGELTKLEY